MKHFSAVLKREKSRILSHSLIALKSAHAIADGSGLPIVKGVLGVAALLVEAAEEVEMDGIRCRQMADRAAGIVLAICEILNKNKHSQSVSALEEAAEVFKRVLYSALEFTQHVRSRGKLHRFYNQDYIRKKVLDLDRSLTAAHEAFMVKVALMGHKSNAQAQEVAMDTRDMVNHIQNVVCATADGVARLHDDDDFYVVKTAEVVILRRLTHLSGSWKGSSVARVRGEERLVKMYQRSAHGDVTRFIKDVMLGRQARNEYVAQVFGYTKGREVRYVIHSLAAPEVWTLKPMMDYIKSATHITGSTSTFGVKNIMVMLKEILRALEYLDMDNIVTAEGDIKQLLQESELVCDSRGKVLIGTGDFKPSQVDSDWSDSDVQGSLSGNAVTGAIPFTPAKRGVEVHWLVGVEFNRIFATHSRGSESASSLIKLAADILNDDNDGLIYNVDWESASDLTTLREFRVLIPTEEEDLCTCWPTNDSVMLPVGEVLRCLEVAGTGEPLVPAVPPKNLAAVFGPVQDYDDPDIKEGHWDHVDCDELLDGIRRCVDIVEILVAIICVFGRYTFYQPREIKSWSCCGGRHAFPSHKQSLDYLRQNYRTLGEEIGCQPYNVAIVTYTQQHFVRAEYSTSELASTTWAEQLYLFLHYNDTETPRRAYWSTSSEPCQKGIPLQPEGSSIHRWSWYNYVQLAASAVSNNSVADAIASDEWYKSAQIS